ncbi:beta-ketoacyl synthase N-terminal-like domain-containing protein [Hyalangium gracile]|uniref:beta-ketoacyl synthase N-terminal-like domain-containing protein n=1 Tax=Hyalangium gracile TaxID=394092 RepID=UPI001CCCAAF8|nr:beta-ketoacyl synthase N-terminal-like domain-containing protein [Hyalangium gracile]
MRPVAVVAASAVSARGLGWRGLGQALRTGTSAATPCEALGGILAAQVPALPAAQDVEPRQRKLMSRGARLSCVAARQLFQEMPSLPREETGFFLGVGASGGAVEELEAMLEGSFSEAHFDVGRFGTAGLNACNPLFAFQLMNNYTLCHAAIREGLRGPNAAIFSRGAGTVLALAEARYAVASGECETALAGGADSALHPVTWAELRRDGYASVMPGEGAAVLALAPQGTGSSLAILERCEVHPRRQQIDLSLESARRSLIAFNPEVVVLAASSGRGGSAHEIAATVGTGAVLQASEFFGETLAASAALATVVALDLLQEGALRVGVLVAGPDESLGIVGLVREGTS